MGSGVKWLAAMAALTGMALTSPSSSRAANAPRITQPDWIQRPSGEDLQEHYPKAAAMLAIDGRSAMNCSTDAFGRLEDCKVVSETPPELGFGAAAVAMAPLFRMRPMTVNGIPTAGGRLTIPISFNMEKEQDPPPTRPVQTEALPYARRLVEDFVPDKQFAAQFGRTADELAFISDGVTPAATAGAAADAYRRAFAARLPELRESYAADLAASLSAADLKTMVDFLATPGGALIAPNDDRQAVLAMIDRERDRVLRSAAHKAFCDRRECDPVRAVKFFPGVKASTVRITQWAQQPTEEELVAARPKLASWLNMTVAARLSCAVDPQALLTDCQVQAETPGGLGGGKAALGFAKAYRVDPVLMSQGVGGDQVAVDVIFHADDLSQPYNAPQPRSPAALKLARQLFDLRFPPDRTTSAVEAWIAGLADAVKQDADDPEVLTAASAALRDGYAAAVDRYREQAASTDAAFFSETQLTEAIAFLRDPATAQALKHIDTALAKLGRVEGLNSRILADARAIFCKSHDCTVR